MCNINPEIQKLIKAESRFKAIVSVCDSQKVKVSKLLKICANYEIAYKGFCILENRLILKGA